jgi:Xaa-Pro dipeptidase
MNAITDNPKALLEGDFQRILQASDSSLKNGEKPFPREEFQRRQDRVREMMRERGIELLLVNEPVNIGYLTGYDTIFPGSWMYLGLPLKGEPWMIAADIELTCARYFTFLENLEYMVGPERGENVLPGEQLMACINKYGQGDLALGVELDMPSWGNGRSMTIRDYETLKKGLPKASFVDASGLVNEARTVKTDLEIEALRQAGLYTVAGHKAAFKALKPGMTEAEIAGLAYGATFAAGGESIGNQGLVAVGEKSGFAPHIPWKRRPIQMGDTVYIEHAGVHNNYNCPQMRSAILGRPSAVQEKADEMLQAVMQNTISKMKSGRLCSDVAVDSRRLLDSFQLPDNVLPGDNFGYSVGFGMPPSWCPDAPVAFIEGCDVVLEPNMVFHTTTYVYSPGMWAIELSETVRVTEQGGELLSTGEFPWLVRVPEDVNW